jgi:uncharacterized protein YcbX
MVNFRPNIALKTEVPYEEDFMVEMRIGNCLLRNIGPTFRCPDTMTDYERQRKNPENEPLQTLGTYRVVPQQGIAFGIYCKMELVTSTRVYQRLFSREQGYQDM